jgi:hypothetical protein
LETSARAEAVRTSAALRARLFASLDAGQQRTTGHRLMLTAETVAEAYLARLLNDGRFSDFRRARTRMHVPFAGRYRQRRLIVTARATASMHRLAEISGRALKPGAAL